MKMDVNYKILIGLILVITLFVNTAQAQEYGLLWSYETGDEVRSVSISSDGSDIAAGSADDKVYLFDREGNLLWSYETGISVESVSISSDGSYIAAGSLGKKVYLFERAGNLLWSYKTGGGVYSVSMSSDGSCIAAEALMIRFTCLTGQEIFYGAIKQVVLFGRYQCLQTVPA